MAQAAIAAFRRGGGFLLALLALIMASAATPQAGAQSSAPSVAGTEWYGTYQYEGEDVVQFEVLRFNRDGTVEGLPLMRGNWVQRGNRVTLDHGTSVPDFVMTGTISGDRMTGTFSQPGFRGTFSVQRGGARAAPPAGGGASVAGTTWQGSYQHVGEGVTQFDSLTFNADGTVTGMPLMYGNWVQRGNRVTMDHGTSVPDFVMEGTINGDVMTGTFSYLGGDYRGTFSVRLSSGGGRNPVVGSNSGGGGIGALGQQDTHWRGRFGDMDYAMILHADRTVSLAYGGDMSTGAWYDDSNWRLNGNRVEFRLYSTEPYAYVGTVQGNVFSGTWSQGDFRFQHDPRGFDPPPMRGQGQGQRPRGSDPATGPGR